MSHWAILSGIAGHLAAYEAVLADLKRVKGGVEALYILGDLVGPQADCEALVRRVRSPRRGEPEPQVCVGWWEEQCFRLHAVGASSETPELIARYGPETVEKLWNSVSRETVQWLRSLHFGFFELDCLLIHGSTLGVDDELTPETPPLQMLDRLIRGEANRLFCGRSGQAFQYQLQSGSVTSSLTSLEGESASQVQTLSPKQIIGVGSVGKIPGEATYTLYHPKSDRASFRTVRYGDRLGFSPTSARQSAP